MNKKTKMLLGVAALGGVAILLLNKKKNFASADGNRSNSPILQFKSLASSPANYTDFVQRTLKSEVLIYDGKNYIGRLPKGSSVRVKLPIGQIANVVSANGLVMSVFEIPASLINTLV